MAEQAWRPRPCCYAHRRSGSPWVPVRPYYEGLPSKEGQYGSDEGRRKPPGSRGMKVPRFGPDEHGPGVEDATSGAPEGGVPRADQTAGAMTLACLNVRCFAENLRTRREVADFATKYQARLTPARNRYRKPHRLAARQRTSAANLLPKMDRS